MSREDERAQICGLVQQPAFNIRAGAEGLRLYHRDLFYAMIR